MTEITSPRSIERFDAVSARVGLSRRQLYRLIADGRFPQPVALSGNSVGFYVDEVTRWIADRPRVSYSPEPQAA